jgi:large subunit ribosomal protein L9
MELILSKNYGPLGFIGEKVVVKNGYARNYLLPKGIAVEINSKNAKKLEHQKRIINAAKEKEKQEALKVADKIQAITLEFKLKVASGERAYGSVTSKDIADALAKEGIEINKRYVTLVEAIKSVGNYEANVKLHTEVVAKVALNVTSEAGKIKRKAKKGKNSEESKSEDVNSEDSADEAQDTEE